MALCFVLCDNESEIQNFAFYCVLSILNLVIDLYHSFILVVLFRYIVPARIMDGQCSVSVSYFLSKLIIYVCIYIFYGNAVKSLKFTN